MFGDLQEDWLQNAAEAEKSWIWVPWLGMTAPTLDPNPSHKSGPSMPGVPKLFPSEGQNWNLTVGNQPEANITKPVSAS